MNGETGDGPETVADADAPTADHSAVEEVGATRSGVSGESTEPGFSAGPETGTVEHHPDDSPLRPGLPNEVPRPRFLGDYELLGEIARGGMGVVYRARQGRLGRLVALKLIRDATLASYTDRRRFQAEAEAIAQLDHPNIVPIYEVGQVNDQPFFSLKLIEGGNLTRHVERLQGDPRAAAALMAKVARAVHYAHQRAILHRDIKPSNILLDENGEPYVTDFGLAKRIEEEEKDRSAATLEGAVMGTPAYMPPEQARGQIRSLTTATDVYSLGATLYEMLSGRPPFAADSVPELLRKVLDQEPDRLRLKNATLDRDLETICLKCLQKDPSRRYGSAEALAEDLENWLDRRPIAARPVSASERLAKWARRRPEIAGLSAAVLVTVVFGLTGVLWQWLAAERNLASLQRSLYDADMKLGEQALANSQFPRVEALVRTHEPKQAGGSDDLRGFEWYYLRAVADPEPMLLRAHARTVEDLKFSPDSTLLATLGVDRIIRLWEVATGRLVRELNSRSDYVKCIAFHPGGTWLASGGYDRTVWLWNVGTGRLVQQFAVPTPIRGLVFSPDGRRLAVGCDDPRVVVLDVETGEIVMRSRLPRTSRGPVEGNIPLAFDHAGTRLVAFNYSESTGVRDQSWILDATTGEPLRALKGGMGVFTPDDRALFHFTRVGWRISDAETGAVLNQSESMQRRRNTPGLSEGYQLPILDSQGRMLFVATGNGVDLWDIEARRTLRTFPLPRLIPMSGDSCLVLSPDDRVLAVNASLGSVILWFNLLGRKTFTIPVNTARLSGLALDPAGRVLAIGGHDGVVRLVDLPGRRVVRTLTGPQGPIYGVAYGPGGRHVAAAGADGRVYLWNAADGRLVRRLSVGGGQALAVAFDPAGRHLAAGGDDRRLRIWDMATGAVVLEVPEAQEGPIQGLAYSPDGRTLASAGGDQTVGLRDAGSGRLLRSLRRDPSTDAAGPFFNVAFSPDSRRIVASCAGGVAVVWDARWARVQLTLSGHVGAVHHAAFSPDGRRVITVGADGAVKLWDAVLGTETFELRHGGPISAAVMTPDGFQLVAAGWDGRLTGWDATPVVRVAGQGIRRAHP